MSFIKDNFMLSTKTAEKLYFDYAKDMPIFDYHCHLPEKQILENKVFTDINEVWLSGDHYKWRLMRNSGISEDFITGERNAREKFKAMCKALSTAFGNPLYHWSHMELKEYFNCELEINEANADQIFDWCNEFIRINKLTPQKLIEQSNVKIIFTTNEIFDDLSTFNEIAKKGYKFKVIPAFRADKIMNCDAVLYKSYIEKLAGLTHEIKDIESLESALEIRLKEFIKVGTVASDISLERVLSIADRNDADKVFKKAISTGEPTLAETETFKGYLTYFLMKLYAKYDIRCELHIGAKRNNNTVMFNKLGLDSGYDSISDYNSLEQMSALFDTLNNQDLLPKTIVFNLNPKMNMEILTLIGTFQDDSAKGKMQYGPAWWFLDNKEGMIKHLKDLTSQYPLGSFVGMLTDSRSFLSYTRHHYFRRILCSYLGELIEEGEVTADLNLVGKTIEDVCYNNSIKYFGE